MSRSIAVVKNGIWPLWLVVVLAGCPAKSPGPTGDVRPPAAAAFDAPTMELVREAGDAATLVVLAYPERWPALHRALVRSLEGNPLGKVVVQHADIWSFFDLLSQKSGGPEMTSPAAGWDRSRPLVAGLFAPEVDDAVLAARALLFDSPEGGVSGIRHRVLVPASDPRRLTQALITMIGKTTLRHDRTADGMAELHGGRLFRSGGAGLLAVIPAKRWVRLEIVTHERRAFAADDAQAARLKQLLAPAPRRLLAPRTPALARALTAEAGLVIHARLWLLRDLASQLGAQMVHAAVIHADPSMRAMLTARGLALVAQSYLLMSPLGAEVDDATVTLHGSADGLRATLTGSLTEQGTRAILAGLKAPVRPPAFDHGPALVRLWSALDLAAALDAVPVPDGMRGMTRVAQLGRTVQECGSLCAVHFLLRSPLGLTKQLRRLLPAAIWGGVPRGFSLQVRPRELKSGLSVPWSVSAAGFFPPTMDPGWLERAVREMNRELRLSRHPITLTRSRAHAPGLIRAGLGVNPDTAFTGGTFAPKQGVIGQLDIDLAALHRSLQKMMQHHETKRFFRKLSPSLRRFVARHQRFSLRVTSDAPQLFAEASLRRVGKKPVAETRFSTPPPFFGLRWESPRLAAASTAGARCLDQVTQAMIQAFSALASVAPGQRTALLEQAVSEVQPSLDCAGEDEATATPAKRMGWQMWSHIARRHGRALDQKGQLAALQRACKAGYAEGCRQHKVAAAEPQVDLPPLESTCARRFDGVDRLFRLPLETSKQDFASDNNMLNRYSVHGLAAPASLKWSAIVPFLSRVMARGGRQLGALARSKQGRTLWLGAELFDPDKTPADAVRQLVLTVDRGSVRLRLQGPRSVGPRTRSVGELAGCSDTGACVDPATLGAAMVGILGSHRDNTWVRLSATARTRWRDMVTILDVALCAGKGVPYRGSRRVFFDVGSDGDTP